MEFKEKHVFGIFQGLMLLVCPFGLHLKISFWNIPNDFVKQGWEPRGITYTEKWKSSKINFHVAVSAALAKDFPTLLSLLRSIAALPSKLFEFLEKKLCKFVKRSTRGNRNSPKENVSASVQTLQAPRAGRRHSTKSCTRTRAVL